MFAYNSVFDDKEQSFLVECNIVGDKVFLIYEHMILNQDIPEDVLACEVTEYAEEGYTGTFEGEMQGYVRL